MIQIVIVKRVNVRNFYKNLKIILKLICTTKLFDEINLMLVLVYWLKTFLIKDCIRSRSTSVKFEPEGRHKPSLNRFSETELP